MLSHLNLLGPILWIVGFSLLIHADYYTNKNPKQVRKNEDFSIKKKIHFVFLMLARMQILIFFLQFLRIFL